MTKSMVLVAVVALFASPAFAQSPSVARAGAQGSTAGNNVGAALKAPAPSASASTSANTNAQGQQYSTSSEAMVGRSGAPGSNAGNNVGAALKAPATSTTANTSTQANVAHSTSDQK